MTRNEARTIMMQILFEMDASGAFKGENPVSCTEKLAKEKLAGNHIERGNNILGNITNNLEKIDALINECSLKWKTNRMPKVDLAIMRLAAGEILYSDDVPEAVTINEAIKLAKEFSTEKSARFVHGVLGNLAEKIRENDL